MSLYPLPQTVTAEVWTRIPDRFNDPERKSGWIDANKPGAKMGSFLEGPTFDTDGNLYVCDIPHGSPGRKQALGRIYLLGCHLPRAATCAPPGLCGLQTSGGAFAD